jgi:hypothetical protein
MAEQLAIREERIAGMERRLRIYEATLAAIDDAERATMKKAARYLEQHMGNDVARITGDRYRRIRVDEQNLSFTVWAPEPGSWVAASALSRGTIDQLYLAARLGLVRQVTQERRPPLIFDDPFVTFDDERANRSLELLKELAADHQVLYLTTSSRYDALADAVFELEGPTARDDAQGEVPEEPPTPPSTEPLLLPELPLATLRPTPTTSAIPWPVEDQPLRPTGARGGAV